jgi:hypothetical protein
MNRYATILGAGVLAGIFVLFILGVLNSPVKADRDAFEYQLRSIAVPDLQFGDPESPEFDGWLQTIATRAKLWEPLFRPQAQGPPPPNLAQQLAGVFPSRNQIGSGETQKVEIQVDGRSGWYVVGQQIKGCEIKEFTDTVVLFSVAQGGLEYRIALPRR